MLTKRKLENLCSVIGHDPERVDGAIEGCDMTEPGDPEPRKVTLGLWFLKCRGCGKLLNAGLGGVLHDPKYA